MEIIFLTAILMAVLVSIMLAKRGKKKTALAAVIAAVLLLRSVYLVFFEEDGKRGCGVTVMTPKDGGDETSLKRLGFRKLELTPGAEFNFYYQFFPWEQCPKEKTTKGPLAAAQREKILKDLREEVWGGLPIPPPNPEYNFNLVAALILSAVAMAAFGFSFFVWRQRRQPLYI